MKKLWCSFCEEEHLELIKKEKVVSYRGEMVTFIEEYYICPELGAFWDGELHQKNLNSVTDNYMKMKGLVFDGKKD